MPRVDLYGVEDEDEFVEERAKAMQDKSAQRHFDVRRVKYPAHLALGDIDRTFNLVVSCASSAVTRALPQRMCC